MGDPQIPTGCREERHERGTTPQQRTYGQIWEQFKADFIPKGLREQELRDIHQRWIDARAYADRELK